MAASKHDHVRYTDLVAICQTLEVSSDTIKALVFWKPELASKNKRAVAAACRALGFVPC